MLSGVPASRVRHCAVQRWTNLMVKTDRTNTERDLMIESRISSSAIIFSTEEQVEELNDSLCILASIFPDIQLEVFREMLATFPGNSRLHVVTEALLKSKAAWVRGRWRVSETREKGAAYQSTVSLGRERFRSAAYVEAVKQAFYQEFRGLTHSTIKGVLAECNHSYTDARPILVGLASKSWRVSLSKLFSRKRVAAQSIDHPMLSWRTSPDGKLEPVLRSTSCAELDAELHDTLLAPIFVQRALDQYRQDEDLAAKLNDEEAEAAEAMYDCDCCYTSNTFENVVVCNTHGHYICYRCITHTMNEALYGQGWSRSIDDARVTLNCIAADTVTCDGTLPHDLVKRALATSDGSLESWYKFEARATMQALAQTQLPLARCPFCDYVEVDDQLSPPIARPNLLAIALAASYVAFCVVLCGLLFAFPPLFILVASFFSILYYLAPPLFSSLFQHITYLRMHFRSALLLLTSTHFGLDVSAPPLTPLSHGRRFYCRHPACQRASCLRCHAAWRDVHKCHESARLALRHAVEAAQAHAIKRTCPRCGVSFVKDSGCNKLVCPCGYRMCYLCRADIGVVGYAHFCQHFRPLGGSRCGECERCDLYREEDEEVVLRRAKERAEREWWEGEGREMSESQREVLRREMVL